MRKGITVVTADHGNAEQMFDLRPDGAYQVRTQPLCSTGAAGDRRPAGARGRAAGGAAARGAGLSNVASTCLELLGFSPPESYRASLLAW